ncbi:MAG: hypothetical protein WC705_02860 [Candidatus Paceibacterota bacterium]|jgi:hypothetical protein
MTKMKVGLLNLGILTMMMLGLLLWVSAYADSKGDVPTNIERIWAALMTILVLSDMGFIIWFNASPRFRNQPSSSTSSARKNALADLDIDEDDD